MAVISKIRTTMEFSGMKFFELLTMIISVIGSIIISYGDMHGFYILIISNVLGAVLFYKTKMHYMFILQLVYTLISINALARLWLLS